MDDLPAEAAPGAAPSVDELQQSLWDAVAAGEWWEPDGRPTIPAEWIAELLTTGDVSSGMIHRLGVQVRNVDIDSRLDLEDSVIERPLLLENVTIHAGISLANARTRRISITKSTVDRIDAPGVIVDGEFDLSGSSTMAIDLSQSHVRRNVSLRSVPGHRFTSSGGVSLLGAEIGGQLSCIGATLTNPGGDTLYADQARISGGVFLRALDPDVRFTSNGTIRLMGAEIGGQLACEGAILSSGGGDTLKADGAKISGDVFLATREANARFESNGRIGLLGAEIDGQLACVGAYLTNPGGETLAVDHARIAGGVFLRARDPKTRFESVGEVRLPGAEIGGNLECAGATLTNPGGNTLNADGAKITGDMFLQALDPDTRFESTGEIRLLGAEIGGQLSFAGATLTNPGGNTLSADGAKFTGGVFLRALDRDTRFESTGEIRLLGAEIASVLSCVGATLTNPDGNTLDAEGAKITGSVILDGTFGSLHLAGIETVRMRLAGTLDDLDMSGARITGYLFLRPSGPWRHVVVTDVSVGPLSDDIDMWPDDVDLRGFRYDGFHNCEERPRQRIAWIRKSTSATGAYHEQPYHQLMTVYQASGRDAWARQVGVAMEQDRTRQITTDAGPKFLQPTAGIVLRLFHRLWGLLTAYGYRPWIALLWLALWIGIGMGVFTWSANSGVMTAVDAPAGAAVSATVCSDVHPCYDGRLYALDVMIPILDVQQERFWLADASAPGSVPYLRAIGGATTRWIALFLNATGWMLTTVFVASIAGWVSRD